MGYYSVSSLSHHLNPVEYTACRIKGSMSEAKSTLIKVILHKLKTCHTLNMLYIVILMSHY